MILAYLSEIVPEQERGRPSLSGLVIADHVVVVVAENYSSTHSKDSCV